MLATQRQFIRLLEEGARDFDVTLGFLTLRLCRALAEARREMARAIPTLGGVRRARAPDAMIVTGAEPRAAELDEEPYWRELTDLFDAAHEQTLSRRWPRVWPRMRWSASRRRASAALRAQMVGPLSPPRSRRRIALVDGLERGADAAFALERSRRGRSRRQGLSSC